ncbi:H/ACA ribonucleoprotein complex subunit 2-like protein [Xenia sp. Carnegie-2017]|uniref:H/ACA ribonucleoprotein complex subunit 2-like protein n=1 Tax=Xenia sp. Carnegie-2017 TaxID=2897299 RepID=UPI001F036237|nr:H/ACA ribonucleoprotein complex subunit 2-like protein [Xenia sp. Carnegie-2017]XP_046849376.1 H/ACA ribonucleoprotein complex subunit 2-like protein [Xenia sp. Carnegie-2017]XP_046849377.1 H/ACA ribonucleoprotein complex subunit 2-like protein [Xenia sp. Carnegie-2017]
MADTNVSIHKKKKKRKEENAVEMEETNTDIDTPKKTKKEVNESSCASPSAGQPTYDELLKMVNEIARPMATKKLTKTLYKTCRKAVKVKSVRRGVKEVTKALRKGEKGVVVLAGDVSPIDVYSHLPVMCEDRNVPYCYIPSKMDLGISVNSKRPTCVVMIKPHEDFMEKYQKCMNEVKCLPFPL